jgi:hypothetical protein
VRGAATAGCGCACVRRVGLSRATAKSNECPAGYVRIATEAACRIAFTLLGGASTVPIEVETDSTTPRGCYALVDKFYFNKDTVGAGDDTYDLVCAAAPAGAPRMRVCLLPLAQYGRDTLEYSNYFRTVASIGGDTVANIGGDTGAEVRTDLLPPPQPAATCLR